MVVISGGGPFPDSSSVNGAQRAMQPDNALHGGAHRGIHQKDYENPDTHEHRGVMVEENQQSKHTRFIPRQPNKAGDGGKRTIFNPNNDNKLAPQEQPVLNAPDPDRIR